MLSEALWLNPGLMEARFHIAILEHELGELDSARERLEDLGDFGATNRCVEWLRSSLDSQGKKIAAPEDLSKSATSAEVFYWCRDKQIRLLRMAALARLPDIADNPLYGLPSRFLSAICWGTGRWEGIDAERALRDLEVARALAPQSPIVLENLSAIYLRSFLKRQESDSSITAANSEEVRRARSILEQDLLRALPQPFITRELTWNNYVSTVYSTLEEREAAVSFARERVQTTGLAEPKRWLVRMRLSDVELMEAEGAEVPESLWDEVLPLIDARIQSADATGVDWLLAAWRAHFFGDAELQAEGVRRARELGVRLAFDIDKLEALGRLAAPAGAVPKSGG
jgi:tetratricopeptide (TPR) repeat protein